MAFTFAEYEPYRRLSRVGILDLGAEPIVLRTFDEAVYADDLLLTGNWLLAPDELGIAALPLSAGSEPVRRNVEDARYLDVLPLADKRGALVELMDGRRELRIFASDGTALSALEVPGTAERLLNVEELIGVLLDQEGNGCERSGSTDCDQLGLGWWSRVRERSSAERACQLQRSNQ